MRRAFALLAVALAGGGALFAAAEATSGTERAPVVAVLDTGVDAAHPELAGRVLAGIDLVGTGEPGGDPSGHGTAVAASVAAACPDCRILPVRVLSRSGAAPWWRVAEGIVRAVDAGATVVNLSIAGPDGSPELREAVAYARSHDVLVVASAGNAGDARRQYPAAYDGVVAVAATGAGGRLLDWSSRGAWVDVAAPGCAALPVRGASALACGTSFAAPLVAGTAARERIGARGMTVGELAARLQALAGAAAPTGSVAVSGRPVPGATLRAAGTGLEPGLGERVRWFRCAPGAGPHDCVAVSAGASYRVRGSDSGSELVARVVTAPFGGLWLAASARFAVA